MSSILDDQGGGGGGGVAGSQPMSTAVHTAHGAQITLEI
jgi:hypothetical protein